ncbi:MAG: hypothetical protein H6556_30130 [Lewinellaceae bacterium]|nr:hypothetical protein [Lewinellaceae bacterium]
MNSTSPAAVPEGDRYSAATSQRRLLTNGGSSSHRFSSWIWYRAVFRFEAVYRKCCRQSSISFSSAMVRLPLLNDGCIYRYAQEVVPGGPCPMRCLPG